MGKMLTIRTVGEGKLLFSITRKPIGNKLMGLLGFNLLLHRQNIQGKNLLVFLSDNIQIRIVIPLCYHNIGHGSIDVGLWGFPRQEQMQVQFAFFFMYEKGSLNACTSCPFRVEPKHSTVFHKMPDPIRVKCSMRCLIPANPVRFMSLSLFMVNSPERMRS